MTLTPDQKDFVANGYAELFLHIEKDFREAQAQEKFDDIILVYIEDKPGEFRVCAAKRLEALKALLKNPNFEKCKSVLATKPAPNKAVVIVATHYGETFTVVQKLEDTTLPVGAMS